MTIQIDTPSKFFGKESLIRYFILIGWEGFDHIHIGTSPYTPTFKEDLILKVKRK